MARIRTIKPEFPQSESIGRLSRDARLLFVQLWTIADDYGRARAAPQLLVGQLYPYDADAPKLIGKWLDELVREGQIRLYEVDGSRYLEIPGWSKHQRVDNAGKSNIPEPRGEPEPPRGDSPRTAANDGEPPLDLGPRKGEDLGPRSIRAVARATRPDADEAFERFWREYPKRGSAANPKKPAKDKFARLIRDGADPEAIIAAAKRFSAIEREAGRYGTEKVAQALTWLNQQRFDDYAEATPTARPTGPPAPGLPSDEELRRKYGAANGEGRSRREVAELAQPDQEPCGEEVLRAGAGIHSSEQLGLRDRAGNAGMRSVGEVLPAHWLGADRLPRDDGAIEGGGGEIDDGPGPVAGVV